MFINKILCYFRIHDWVEVLWWDIDDPLLEIKGGERRCERCGKWQHLDVNRGVGYNKLYWLDGRWETGDSNAS